MNDHNDCRYTPGRGLPLYLLSRNYETSSNDSDGASRIFASSRHSTTSDRGNNSSSILQLPRTFTYMSTSSSFTWSDTTSISMTPSTFEYSTSSTTRSIDDETRTIRSGIHPIDQDSVSGYSNASSVNKNSSSLIEKSASKYSFMDVVFARPICPTRSSDDNTIVSDNYHHNISIFQDPENMFPPYIRIFSNKEDEPQHEEAEFSADMVVDGVQTETSNTFTTTTSEPINYDQCCLFDDKT